MLHTRRSIRLLLACALAAAFTTAPTATATSERPSLAGKPGRTADTRPRTAEQTSTIVVGFEQGREAEALAAIAGSGAKVTRRSRAGGFAVVRVPDSASVDDFLSRVTRDASVRYAEPEGEVRATLVPDDTRFADQWNMTRIGAPAAWDTTRGDSDVVIAILDTGVDLLHPDLVDRMDTANDRDFINSDYVAADDNGHGTHVAGIAGATTDNAMGVAGVANQCTILPVKVLRSDGGGTSSGVAEGVRWAADKGADIISMSLGTSRYETVLHEAIQYAVSKDCVVVAASGNDGRGTILYPARLPDVIAVGSTASQDTLSTFSNFGPELDITAPGTAIPSTMRNASYGNMSGTSMATPHVAGVAALLRARHPLWTRDLIEQQLLSSVVDLGAPGRDNYFGFGRVDARAAVESTFDPLPPEFDDDIPGATLRSSPMRGDVDAEADSHDVYWVDLSAGEMLVLSLTSTADTDFDVSLYDPAANSITTDTPVARSAGTTYPEVMQFTAASSGRHYIDVASFAGQGNYTLSYSVRAAGTPADDDIPGIPLPATPVTGDLDAEHDIDDVFALRLAQGERLTLSLDGPEPSDFDAYLFGPDATSVLDDEPVAGAETSTYPDAFSYVAEQDGVYYLDAFAYTGSGAYTLNYHVSPATLDDDGDIPGSPFRSNPATDTLDAGSDLTDVRAFYVAEGQSVSVRMASDMAENLDLFVYGPGAVTASPESAIGISDGPDSDEEVSFTATRSGVHYVACRATAGLGEYRIEYSVLGDIPGFPLSPSPVSGELSEIQRHQVYRIDVLSGQRLYLGLKGDPSTDFDLRLFAPEATSVSQGAHVVAQSLADGSDEQIMYLAGRDGTYFIDVQAYSGQGGFELIWGLPANSAVVTISAPASIGFGSFAMVTGRVTSASGAPVAGRVTLQRSAPGVSAWSDYQDSATDSAGGFTFPVRPADKTDYRVVFNGNADFTDSPSSAVGVTPLPLVSNPAAPARMLQGRPATVWGTLQPAHASGSVRIYRYRYVSGAWVKYGYVSAPVTDASEPSRYAAAVSLPYRGTWRLRAYAPADAEHGANWSAGYDYVAVDTRGDRAVTLAKRLVGSRYQWGAAGPLRFDSSGFTQYVYAQLGVRLPRTAAMQSRSGVAVKRGYLRPGDLVFFSSPARHVAIYVGGGLMIDCTRSSGSVRLRRLYSNYSSARRVW